MKDAGLLAIVSINVYTLMVGNLTESVHLEDKHVLASSVITHQKACLSLSLATSDILVY